MSKVLSKVPNRKKTSKQQYSFCDDMISLEVHDMQWEAKFLRERQFKATNNTTFAGLRFLYRNSWYIVMY